MPLGTKVGLGQGDIVLVGDPAPPKKGGTAARTFRPMSVVAKRSPISATAELVVLVIVNQQDIDCLAGGFACGRQS